MKPMTPDSKAHAQVDQSKQTCGFTWQSKHPDYMTYTCVRKPDHKGRHRSLRGAMKAQ